MVAFTPVLLFKFQSKPILAAIQIIIKKKSHS